MTAATSERAAHVRDSVLSRSADSRHSYALGYLLTAVLNADTLTEAQQVAQGIDQALPTPGVRA